jgi:hypothetical protein
MRLIGSSCVPPASWILLPSDGHERVVRRPPVRRQDALSDDERMFPLISNVSSFEQRPTSAS